MISNAENIFLDMLRKQLIGKHLPTKFEGLAGRAIEDLLISIGVPVDKTGSVDIPELELEVKSRDRRSTSPQTAGSMTIQDILNTPEWTDTTFYKKICKQLRFTTNGYKPEINVIESIDIIDFDQDHIQEHFKLSYEHSRSQLLKNNKIKTCAHKGFFGYLEQVNNSNSYAFRLDSGRMDTVISMSKSTFQNLFEYDR